MADKKDNTGGFIETTFHPPGCGHKRPDHEDEDDSEGSGPSQVATEAYRKGYDTIFGKKKDVGNA